MKSFSKIFLVKQKVCVLIYLECVGSKDCNHGRRARIISVFTALFYSNSFEKDRKYILRVSYPCHNTIITSSCLSWRTKLEHFGRHPRLDPVYKIVSYLLYTCLRDELIISRRTTAHKQLTINIPRMYENSLHDLESKQNCIYSLAFVCILFFLKKFKFFNMTF